MRNPSSCDFWSRRRFCGALLTASAGTILPRAACAQREFPLWRQLVSSSRTIKVGGASIEIDFSTAGADLPTEKVVQWIEHAAQAVTTYYGRFPVPRERVLIEFAEKRSGVGGATTWGDVGGVPAFTRIRVGEQTSSDDFNDDWTMTHEMVHTAFPTQEDEHHWIEEGLATYIEPIARVQAGFLRPERIWVDMVRDMPKGDPEPSDRGLDQTHTWGRTYWGGAQFCLLADVTIRQETKNRKGLQDALRAIIDAGGTIDQEWPIAKAFSTGDQATGTQVLMTQYKQMSDTPMPVDLNGLWKELGVEAFEGGVRFNDGAPSAAIRRAITQVPRA